MPATHGPDDSGGGGRGAGRLARRSAVRRPVHAGWSVTGPAASPAGRPEPLTDRRRRRRRRRPASQGRPRRTDRPAAGAMLPI